MEGPRDSRRDRRRIRGEPVLEAEVNRERSPPRPVDASKRPICMQMSRPAASLGLNNFRSELELPEPNAYSDGPRLSTTC